MKVSLIEFGRGTRDLDLDRGEISLEELLNEFGVETQGRRVAVNGNPAERGAVVREGDQLSVVPRVQGG